MDLKTVYIKVKDAADNVSDIAGDTIEIDNTIPGKPVVNGESCTEKTLPQWSWESGGNGSGTYRYKLDDDDLTQNTIVTTGTSFTPAVSSTSNSVLSHNCESRWFVNSLF